MERTIEREIDNGLESISSQLYIFSVGLGIALVILGIILFFTNRVSKEKKGISNSGLICFIVGIVAIVSGLVQI
ncbi:hypothetical protein EDD76_112123 [Kineothrix alysoides]|uniref:Uncharacterized protein n=1 Tax=Kineothrix alysoides TaxID=1469948 RepID=A0A4R1QUT9_9FIRM|nr:hypothetical protein [Kineothrix alysoides]TCL56295.1 hypothetical protein EDD76_112123 [Kineothrix alysoides]